MNICRLLTIPTLLLLLVISFPGQSTNNEFVSGRARFAITPLSSTQPRFGSVNEEFGVYAVFGDTFVWSNETRHVSVAHLVPWQKKGSSPSLTLSPSAKKLILSHYKDVFKADFAKQSVTVEENSFDFNGSKGVEFRVSGEHRSIVRQFFLGNRFYILVAQFRGASGVDGQKGILDTFRRLDGDEYNAAMIREAEPAALPQDVPTGVRPTDAIEMALKGDVKHVSESVEDGMSKRLVPISEQSLSRLGYLTRKVTYNEGFPESIANYGWVDGVRAINLAPITHLGEGKIVTRGTVVGWAAPEGFNVITRTPTGQLVDLRFTAKFESKYDDQWLLTERREISNSGSVNSVEKISYMRTGRDIKTEDNSGGFISRRFEVLDKGGNIVEIRTLDDRGNVSGTTRFLYEFDSKGNWTVRRSAGMRRPGVKGPTSVTVFRKIEYYD